VMGTCAQLFSALQCSVHLDLSGLTYSQQQTSAMYSCYSIKAWKCQNIEPKPLEHFSILIRFPLNTGIYVCLRNQTNYTVLAQCIYSLNREQSDVCTVCTACEQYSVTKPCKLLVSCTIFLQYYVVGGVTVILYGQLEPEEHHLKRMPFKGEIFAARNAVSMG
jgi:hypothetical protein